MKAYIMFGVKSFTKQMSYRSEVWLRLLGNFAVIFIQAEIWKAVIGSGQVDGVSAQQMITYSIINTLMLALLLHRMSSQVDGSLKSGAIASELTKPLSYPLFLLSSGLGSSGYQLVFTVIPSLLIAWFAFGLIPPASGLHFAGFLAAIGLALSISFLLGYLISLIAFWVMNHFALDWMLGGFITIFSGTFLPLWFFPEAWQSAAGWLPFQFLGYVPAAVYLGTLSVTETMVLLVKGVAWSAILLVIVHKLWKKAVRRLVIQGG
ncbi:ABC transporter permease [Paenibacillus lemnae]|uniref:ABC transporter permease n=1 Tax=Paenibacillus lemnae TaxID=1330551 RepID=A0A848MCU5_PAELE|nr:ABC-2 family transporter protein [Paenibacillus lemnae]NMO97960.1 ABC transporter permease [Paenibacillus lemnae]